MMTHDVKEVTHKFNQVVLPVAIFVFAVIKPFLIH